MSPRARRWDVDRCGRLAEKAISKIEVVPPIDRKHVVSAGTPMEADSLTDRFAERSIEERRITAGKTVQLVRWTRCLAGQKLASRISPKVELGPGEVKRPRSVQGEKLVLVYRQVFLSLGIASKPGTEPMRKTFVQVAHRFAETATR